jgi:hypothetical protein
MSASTVVVAANAQLLRRLALRPADEAASPTSPPRRPLGSPPERTRSASPAPPR